MTSPDNVPDIAGSPESINRTLEVMWTKLAEMIGEGGGSVVIPAGSTTAKRAWQRSLAAKAEGLMRLVLIGDSWAAPVGASRPDRGWYSLVAEKLDPKNNARHISPRAPHSVRLEGNASFDENANPHMITLAGDGRSFFFDLSSYNSIDLIYVRVGDVSAPEAGMPRYQVNGVGPLLVPDSDVELFSPGTSYRLARITNWQGNSITVAPHETAPSGSIFFGIIARRGVVNQGVEVINWAREGYTTQDWASRLGIWNIVEPFRALPATGGLIVSLGANDASKNISIEAMVTNLRNVVGAYLDAVARVPVAFVLLPNPDDTPSLNATWDARMDALIELCAEYDGLVFDLRKEMGPQSLISPQLTPANDFHLRDAGHEYMSNVVVKALT